MMQRFRRFYMLILWVALPLVIVTFLESRVRKSTTWPQWYEALCASSDRAPSAVFVGSSRVAAALDSDAFVSEVGKLTGRSVTTENMGRGYSTLIQHLHGLRALAELSSDRLAGCTVFIEAPCGMPTSESKRDTWVSREYPGLLVPTLRWGDLPALWRSHTPRELKLRLVVDFLFRSCDIWETRKGWRGWRLETGQRLVRKALLGPSEIRPEDVNSDLVNAGGIMTDAKSMARAKRLAYDRAESKFEDAVEIKDWDSRLVADIFRLVRSNGGKVAFFVMPMSSVMARPYSHPLFQASTKNFTEWADATGCLVLRPNFETEDEDFPDLWHLRQQRAGEFSRSLARSWYRSLFSADGTGQE